ncbi:hypothetical protein MN869_09535 [Acinetobacter sp. NIPH1876]|uniref:hypothetical protein n=1 Tax=Acinetobacter sp. NIPH1876 TaxID=2924041 RepID=UPI001FADC276|nr:hypothetical protein [Acinetobacter sp. NIPH1876]MCJ0828688.1 hypothetical protein [Acinetobacter sp. NIPH1876]
MKESILIPDDATHKVVWGDMTYLYKHEKGFWYAWIGNAWDDVVGLRIYWFFGWKLQTKISSIAHKLIPIKCTKKMQKI